MTYKPLIDPNTHKPLLEARGIRFEIELLQDLKCIMGHDCYSLLMGILKDRGHTWDCTDEEFRLYLSDADWGRYLHEKACREARSGELNSRTIKLQEFE